MISDWKPVQLSLTPEMEQEQVKIHDDYIYYSHNHWFPEIGDVRINYDFAGMCDPANPNYVRNIPYFLVRKLSSPAGQYNSSSVTWRTTDHLLQCRSGGGATSVALRCGVTRG